MEKIAVIDLGSNSVRLVLANILPSEHYVVFDGQKETIRLGQDIERDGFIKPTRIAQTVRTLKMFQKLCDRYGVDKTVAVASSALKRAKNQKSFIEEINSVCGFKFKILTEEEEAMNIYQGVINSLDIPKGVIMDISGSYLHLIQYNRRNIINRECFQFGSLTLSDLFAGQEPELQAQLVYTFVMEQLKNIPWLSQIEPEYQFIGVGGSFRNLCKISRRMKRYPLDMVHNFNVSEVDFNSIYDIVKTAPPEKRTKIKGLNSERADIFSVSLTAVKAVMTEGKFVNIVISGSGSREGIMFNNAVPITLEKPLNDVLGHSIYTMMNYYDINIPHAEHVCNLSIQLYKQLRVLHKLPRQYVRVLRVAALMHDAGMRIKFYDHNRHTFYFILNSNLFGLSHREIVLAAFIAQGHRSDEFNLAEWNKYKDILRDEDLIAVMKLSVILHIAESLDRSMSASVKTINCDVLGDSVIMKTEVEGDCSLEIEDASKVSGEFARAYRKNLEIL